jgi:hypothetical protein
MNICSLHIPRGNYRVEGRSSGDFYVLRILTEHQSVGGESLPGKERFPIGEQLPLQWPNW